MTSNIKGPGIFLAQFAGDEAPFNTLAGMAEWAAELGYTGLQIPTWDARLFDLAKAAESQTYCDEIKGTLAEHGLQVSELSTHLQGQLVAVHPAYDTAFDGFAHESVRGKPAARQEWAVNQLLQAARASGKLGLKAHASFSGSLAWPYLYPWPQRPPGLIETAFDELAKRWRPILDAFDSHGVDVCYEIHPGEDLHDGMSYEMFLERVDCHPRARILYDPSHFVLQQLNHVTFIDFYHERIGAFHAKDAEFNPTGKQGVYGGFQSWLDRAGRFRSLGDGQVRFPEVFSKLAQYGYDGWAVLEWECCLKSPEVGAREGAEFIAAHIIPVTDKAFDDFAAAGTRAAAPAVCASAWLVVERVPSSAPSTASRRASTTNGNSSPAPFRPTPPAAGAAASTCGLTRSGAMAPSKKWRQTKPPAQTGLTRSPSSPPTTSTTPPQAPSSPPGST